MAEVAEPRLGFRVVRIEVAAEEKTESPELVWLAWVTEDEDPDTVVLGYLRTASPTGWAQARAVATVFGRSFATASNEGRFEQWIRDYVLEHLYDTARRAINAQAASMDLTLEIPTKAPEIELARIAAPASEVED